MLRPLIALLLLSGCYRMPTDEDYCTNPTTNNPSITCEPQSGGLPGMKY